jgi:hypothetical protein
MSIPHARLLMVSVAVTQVLRLIEQATFFLVRVEQCLAGCTANVLWHRTRRFVLWPPISTFSTTKPTSLFESNEVETHEN